ncbi:MAG: MBOAT family protein [Anaerolineae bacterium]|nr:MBOAT family protein [Anaerolineae bacterium]
MTLGAVLVMIVAALAAWMLPRRLDGLLVMSLIALFALQSGPDPLLVALPVATVLLVLGVWWLVTPDAAPEDRRAALLIALITFAVALARAALVPQAPDQPATTLRLPLLALGPLLAAGAGAAALGWLVPDDIAARRRLALGFILLIIVLLAVLKTPALQNAATGALLPVQADLTPVWGWLGFSYIAFRLMHVLLDFRASRLGAVNLRDFALYVTFFPALTAGPIARIEHFTKELAAPVRLDTARLIDGGRRIGIGLFKKFVLADTLALVALGPGLAAQADAGPALWWLMLYGYAFRIYFDFAGYVDIAIGIGRLAGIGLPENFQAPYLKRNIGQFWNSWHITLSTWFRLYFFTPLSRALMATPLRSQKLLIILIAQVSSMALIGLWHGVALNFVLWGAWHGLGLWLHRTLTERTGGWDAFVAARPALSRVVHVLSVLATFHFVALGWVFFALGDPALILRTLHGLFGMG